MICSVSLFYLLFPFIHMQKERKKNYIKCRVFQYVYKTGLSIDMRCWVVNMKWSEIYKDCIWKEITRGLDLSETLYVQRSFEFAGMHTHPPPQHP